MIDPTFGLCVAQWFGKAAIDYFLGCREFLCQTWAVLRATEHFRASTTCRYAIGGEQQTNSAMYQSNEFLASFARERGAGETLNELLLATRIPVCLGGLNEAFPITEEVVDARRRDVQGFAYVTDANARFAGLVDDAGRSEQYALIG